MGNCEPGCVTRHAFAFGYDRIIPKRPFQMVQAKFLTVSLWLAVPQPYSGKFSQLIEKNGTADFATKRLPSVALLFLQLASMGGMIRWGLQSQQRFWREDFSPKKDPCPELPSLTARRRGRNLGKDWWQGKSLGILEVSTCSLSGIRDFTGRLRRNLDFIHFCMINCTISGLCGDLRRTSSTKNCRELSSMTATVSSRNSLKVNWTGRIFLVLF